MVQQQVRVDDDPVLRTGAFRQQAAQPVAAGVRQVLRPQQEVAEGQPGRDAILLHQCKDLSGVIPAKAGASPAPDAVGRCAIQGGDAAPIVKILPVLPEQRQKHPVKIVKFKQARQMIAGGGCGHGETAPPLCGYPYCTTPPGKRQENSPRRESAGGCVTNRICPESSYSWSCSSWPGVSSSTWAASSCRASTPVACSSDCSS